MLVGEYETLDGVEGKDGRQDHAEEVEAEEEDQLCLVLTAATVDQFDNRRFFFITVLLTVTTGELLIAAKPLGRGG